MKSLVKTQALVTNWAINNTYPCNGSKKPKNLNKDAKTLVDNRDL